jgi:hypothetical protein
MIKRIRPDKGNDVLCHCIRCRSATAVRKGQQLLDAEEGGKFEKIEQLSDTPLIVLKLIAPEAFKVGSMLILCSATISLPVILTHNNPQLTATHESTLSGVLREQSISERQIADAVPKQTPIPTPTLSLLPPLDLRIITNSIRN